MSAVAVVELPWIDGGQVEVTLEDVLQGAVQVDCPDCCGCGLIPWLPWGAVEECVVCKGTGDIYLGL